MKLTEFAVKRKVATLAVVSAFVVLGVASFVQLPVDFLPSITYPLIKVHIWWRGATTEEVEEHIADALEKEMASLEGLDYLESSSTEGGYTLQVNFRYDVDVNVAFQDVQAAMVRAERKLPKDMDPPVIIKADPQLLPVVELAISSTEWDMVELRDWVDNWLLDRVIAVPGVAGGDITGGLLREIRINLDPLTLERYQLSVNDIKAAVETANVEKFAGRLTTKDREIIIRTMGELKSLQEIEDIVLKVEGTSKVRLKDVADVEDGHEEIRIVTRLDSSPCVKFSVHKQPDANTVEVETSLQRRLSKLKENMPEHVKIDFLESQAEYVETSLASVKTAMIQAAILLLIVTVLFLGSLRQTMVLMITLPVVLIASFSIMHTLDFSINLLSVAGIIIALGILLDSAIVVIENITRVTRETQDFSKQSFVTAAMQVTSAVVASTLTLLALFTPYLLVSGLTSLLFRELILVVAGIMVMSTISAITFVPMMGSLLMSRKKKKNTKHNEKKTKHKENSTKKKKAFFGTRAFGWFQNGYGILVSHLIKLRWIVLIIFLGITLWAGFISFHVQSEFLPVLDDGRIMVKVKLPTGTSVQKTDALLARIEERVINDPLVESAFTLTGGKVWGLYTFEVANEGQINIQLVSRDKRSITTEQYRQRLQKRLSKPAPPGGKIMARKQRIKGIRKMGESDLEIQVRGGSMEKLFELAAKITRTAQNLPYLTNVHLGMDMTKPELHVHLDRTRMADRSITAADVADTLQALVHGVVATRYQEGTDLYSIRLKIPEIKLTNKEDIENLIITNKSGHRFRLRDIATVKSRSGPVEIVRENQSKLVVVRADVKDASVGKSLQELKKEIARIKLPTGYEITYGGKARYMQDLTGSALKILGLAVFLALVVLAALFNSVRYPLIIILSIPASAAGMIFALSITDLAIGATVLVGFLVVVGATINDGVLLFTLADELRTRVQTISGIGRSSIQDAGKNTEDNNQESNNNGQSLSAREAVRKSAEVRLRPRIMTTVTTTAGLLPLALNLGGGGEMLQPLAVGAIGGLLLEIPVALFLMPCLYIIVTKEKRTQNSLPTDPKKDTPCDETSKDRTTHETGEMPISPKTPGKTENPDTTNPDTAEDHDKTENPDTTNPDTAEDHDKNQNTT